MNTCKQEFLNKGCMCLADPMDPWSKICGYINRENGLVFPCDPGCCLSECQATTLGPRFSVEIRKSGGTSLPSGFGDNLQTSTNPTQPTGAANIETTGWIDASPRDRKVWHLALCGAFLILIIFLCAWELS